LRDAQCGDDDAAIERARLAANPKIAWSLARRLHALDFHTQRRPIRNILMSAWAASLFCGDAPQAGGIGRGALDSFGSGPTSAAP
jgi:hypothetical protein